jgi:hypothetical protein
MPLVSSMSYLTPFFHEAVSMHKILIVLAAGMLLGGKASATQFPNASCPDSVTIRKIQDVAAMCHPAGGDTVRGVAGIIIGFDHSPTQFDTYIQNSQGGPFSGIDFFTGGVSLTASPYNFSIGDSIVVEFATVAEFQGMTEMQAPNGSISQPNFIVRRASSGNALPPFFQGTTTQLKESSSNTVAEQYEGCLVRLQTSTHVARNSNTGGLGQINAFLLVFGGSPGDSVFIDGLKLVSYPPPAVNTTVLAAQGILNQATRGYRIMPRDSSDIVIATPPNLIDAYPLTDNTIEVSFDRNVTTASATNTANYSLASFGTVNGAVMLSPSQVQLTITNGLAHGGTETVTVNGIVGQDAGLTMTTPQSRTFVNGVLTAEEVQRANPDSLAGTPCVDRSRFAGSGGQLAQGNPGVRASLAGIVSGRFGSIYYLADAGNPSRGGVAAFAPPGTLTLGDRYRLTGQVQEFFGETEFSNIIEAARLGASVVPDADTIRVGQAALDICDASNTLDDGEDYEGRLATLVNVITVDRPNPPGSSGFYVADRSHPDTIFAQNFNGVISPFTPPPNGHYVSVTGMVHYGGGTFRICPRSTDDIVDHGLVSVDPSLGAGTVSLFNVSPNPSRLPRFSFSLLEPEDIEIGIYDVAGRRLATLHEGRLPAGSYTRDWSGEDASGRPLDAGVFFARLTAGGRTRAIRLVYLGR